MPSVKTIAVASAVALGCAGSLVATTAYASPGSGEFLKTEQPVGALNSSELQVDFEHAGEQLFRIAEAARVAEEQAAIARAAAAAEAERVAAEQAAAAEAARVAEEQAAAERAAAAQARAAAAEERAEDEAEDEAGAEATTGNSNENVAEDDSDASASDSDAGSSYAGGGAVSAALSRVGMSYVRGGSGPSSFDCSGLTMWAYRQAGISLPHYSGAQMAAGTPVSIGNMQPGDLMFFGGGGSRHVAMYIGNGQVVHATNPRSGVVVGTYQYEMARGDFAGVRRYL